MIIFVPSGDNADPTRNPAWYDDLYDYFCLLWSENFRIVRALFYTSSIVTRRSMTASSRQTRQRDIIFGIKQAVHLRPAGLKQCGHSVPRNPLLPHGLRQLPRDHLLDRLRLRIFEYALLLQEVSMLEPMFFLLIAPTPSFASEPVPGPHPPSRAFS